MKIKIIKIIIVITVITGWMVFPAGLAEAVIKRAGDIEVITDEPMFAGTIVWYPGLRVEKSFQVKNRGGGAKTAQIEAENESETLLLSGVLMIQIKEGARGTLRNFFDSAAVSLGEVIPNDSGKTFSVAVTMPAGTGNEYQGGRAKFDLRIGFAGDSASTVTVSGGGAGETEGREGSEGQEGGRQNPEGEREGPGESGGAEEGGKPGEVAGVETEGVDWGFWAMTGGLVAFGGLAGLVWRRRSR